MTEEERRQFDMQRKNFFKGSIAIIITYGVLVLLLSLAGIVNEKVRKLVFEDGFAFTVTLFSGIILIVLLLLIQVYTYGGASKEKIMTENTVCPDYWELKKTPKEVLDQITDPKVKTLSAYYCEKPQAYKPDINVNGITTTSSAELKELKTSIAEKYNTITGLPNTAKMTCERLYPDYMAFIDNKMFPETPTKVRCAYISHCADASVNGQNGESNAEKIIWTSVCPNLA
jgi:hypothetical protein